MVVVGWEVGREGGKRMKVVLAALLVDGIFDFWVMMGGVYTQYSM